MESGGFRFERFTLDPRDRQLRRDGAPVELNARYLDALQSATEHLPVPDPAASPDTMLADQGGAAAGPGEPFLQLGQQTLVVDDGKGRQEDFQ